MDVVVVVAVADEVAGVCVSVRDDGACSALPADDAF
jgi:hypothetical protein